LDQLIVFVLLGLGPAALIAALAVSLVVQYRGDGVINLAAGAIATFGAYAFYTLNVQVGWSLVPSAIGGLGMCLVLGLFLDFVIFRRLRSAAPLAKLVASLGILLTMQAAFVLIYGVNGNSAPAILPTSTTVHVFGSPIPLDRFYFAAIVAFVAVVLAAIYRFTLLGLATRAAAENEGGAVLLGLAPTRIALYNTLLATLIAGLFGMLVASQTQLDAYTISLAVVPALAAALLGGFTSFGIAAAAGMAIGIVETVLVYLQTKPWFPTVQGNYIPGVSALFTFLVVVGALWFRGAKLPHRGALRERPLPTAPEARRIWPAAIGSTAACVALFMVLAPEFRQGLINSLIGVVLCLALVVIIGYVGQVSLMHLALAGVAAFAVQKLTVQAGVGFPLSPIIAVAVAVVFGVVAAVPSLRLRGVTLAIGTLAAAVAIEQFGFDNTTFGQDRNGSILPTPTVFGLHLGPSAHFPGWDAKLPSPVPGLVCLVVTVLVAVSVVSLRRSVFGQHMLAVRSNESAAAAAGVNVKSVKIMGFAISAGIAGIGGVMTAYSLGTVDASSFGISAGLALVAFAYLGGITTVSGAVLAGVLVPAGLSGVALDQWTGLGLNWLNLMGGVVLVYTVLFYPEGIALATRMQFERALSRFRRAPTAAIAPSGSRSRI
jgi:branched-chain amino acid transport system permease protein